MNCKACGAELVMRERKAIDSRNDKDAAATGEKEDLCFTCYAISAQAYEQLLVTTAEERDNELYHFCIQDFPQGGEWNVDS